MGRPAVRAREDRRDSRAPRTRRCARATSTTSLRQSEAATIVTIRGFRDVDYVDALVEDRRDRGPIPTLKRLVFIRREHARRRSCRTRICGAGRAQVVRSGRSTTQQRAYRRRRRDQHAVHVGHDRISQGRDALQPEHRQQRLRSWEACSAYAGRPAVPVRAAVSLFRLRHRRAGRVHPRRLPVRGRGVRSDARARRRSIASAAPALYGVPTMFIAELRVDRTSASYDLDVAADRRHGRRAVSRAADATRDDGRCTCRRSRSPTA